MTKRFLVPLALLAAFALTACADLESKPPPTPPADGLTLARAVTIAQPIAQALSSTPVAAVSEKSGQYADFREGAPTGVGARWVWSVIFTGTFKQPGGPAGSSPLPDRYSVLVMLDYRSGEFIQTISAGDYSPDY